jgi:hypothetical protein
MEESVKLCKLCRHFCRRTQYKEKRSQGVKPMNQQQMKPTPCKLCQKSRRNRKSKLYTKFSSIRRHITRQHKPDYAHFMFLRELSTMQQAIEVLKQ